MLFVCVLLITAVGLVFVLWYVGCVVLLFVVLSGLWCGVGFVCMCLVLILCLMWCALVCCVVVVMFAPLCFGVVVVVKCVGG